MKGLAKLLSGTAVTLLFSFWLSGVAAAEISFDPAVYKALADADSAATIPPGTKITTANWQQYKQFMSPWMQAAFSGRYYWKVEPKPEYTVEVGPTVHYAQPTKYVENTEKYGGQTTLVQLPTGGFTWKSYVAGAPFPNPKEPNMGVKILFNRWADFRPMISQFYAYNWIVDRFGNVTNLRSNDGFFRLSHLSEPGQPSDLPFSKGTFYSSRFMVELPEQSKYTTELTLQPDDPSKYEEIYVFLPSLRRSLRLSSSARCSPILGTDFIQDDNSWLPSDYQISVLGKKKLLVAIADPSKAFDHASYVTPPAGFPGWMKSGTGKWQLRDLWVLDLKWLPSRGAYCYSHRIFVVDPETWIAYWSENYDNNGKFWKVLWVVWVPTDFRGQHTLIDIASVAAAMSIDFQNNHITATVETPTLTDDNAPGDFKDLAVVTTPGGLTRILR